MTRVKDENRTVPKGELNRAKLLKFLSNPDNDWPKRQDYSIHILGYTSDNTMYNTLTPQEITDIEKEALEIIKAQSSRHRKVLYKALYDEGRKGNVKAIKEFLDRTEGKIKDRLEHSICFEDMLAELAG